MIISLGEFVQPSTFPDCSILINLFNRKFPLLRGGLYRDDGLFVIPNSTPQVVDRIRKDISRFFNDIGLTIVFDPNSNSKVVNFLDVTLNLHTGLYYPYRKPGESLNPSASFLDQKTPRRTAEVERRMLSYNHFSEFSEE